MTGLTLAQIVVALSMSLAAVCFFVWAVLSGMFRDVEEIKHRVCEAEDEEDRMHAGDVTWYAGGDIGERSGGVNGWLIAVYLALGLWAVYYLFTMWAGLGPGLDY